MEKFVNTMYDAITQGMEKEFPERVAFRYYTEETDMVTTVLFKELAQDVRRTVTYLQSTIPDVKGKKVCLLSKNSYEYVVNTFGAIMAGCVLVPMNQRKSWAEMSHELELVEPAVILTDGEDYGNKAQLEAAYGSLLHPMDDFRRYEPAAELHPIGHDDLMVLMFTSGTTGLSKGVMMSERNLFSAGQVLWAISAQLADKIDLTKPLPGHYMVLPMFHLGAFIDLFSTTVMGWPLNLGSDIRDFYRDIQKMPSQIMSVVPMIMNALHKDVMRGHRDRLGDLWVPIGSSAMFDGAMLAELAQRGMMITQVYGMTETCGDGIINYEQDEKHIRAVGKPDDHAEYKLDETGEICIRGGCVMLGYYKDPEATAEVLDADGWFHTGDLARVDEEGFYYITGRKKNIIILDNGENVSPEELENLLSKCEAVKECIVREKGKKICAVIYCGEADQQTVRDFITETNRTLPLYKRMSAVEFSTEPLPRTGTGKLLRK